MTLRTLTFDDERYKLVPLEPAVAIVTHGRIGYRQVMNGVEPDDHDAVANGYRAMVSNTPDTLPGVVEHPAPAQPVERQELSDPQIRGIAVCDGGGYQDDKTAVWTFSDDNLLKFARAMLAAAPSTQQGGGE